jgi:hypothetical protein
MYAGTTTRAATTRHSATGSTSTLPCAATTRLRLHALYVDLAVRVTTRSRPHGFTSTSSCAATTRLRLHALRQPCRAPRVLVSTLPAAAIYIEYSASRRLVVDYFTSAARVGASARRAARHMARRAARRRLLRLAQARRRLLHLRRATGCLGTSRGSSRRSSSTTPGSSSTTSPTPRVRVPRYVARPVTGFVVDYSVHRNFLFAATLALLQPRCASRLLVSRQHWLYFEYAARLYDVVFRSHHVDHSSRLVFQTSRERQSRPQQLVGINSD